MQTQRLEPSVPWLRIEAEESDWKAIDRREHLRMLEQLLLIRRFEESLLELVQQGLLHGPAHSSIGQEAVAVGCMSTLRTSDKINGTHRMHHQFLAKALNHVRAPDYDPERDEGSMAMSAMVYSLQAMNLLCARRRSITP